MNSFTKFTSMMVNSILAILGLLFIVTIAVVLLIISPVLLTLGLAMFVLNALDPAK